MSIGSWISVSGLAEELHHVVRFVLPGSEEHLLHGIALRAPGYACAHHVVGERTIHVFLG